MDQSGVDFSMRVGGITCFFVPLPGDKRVAGYVQKLMRFTRQNVMEHFSI